MATAFFGFFAAITLFSALAVAWQKNLLYAAFLLLATFLGIAGLFLMANAEFLAVTQILIYVGGVLSLLLFGILMTKRRENRFLTSGIKDAKVAAFLALTIAVGLFYVVHQESVLLIKNTNEPSTTQLIGKGLLGQYLMPFEIVGVLLLVILIGVLAISAAASEIGRTKESSLEKKL